MNELRSAVERFLATKRLSQAQWARQLGISPQRLQQILDGTSVPSLPLALRMADASDIDIKLFAAGGPDGRMAGSKHVA